MIEQESFLFLFTTFYVKSDILNWRYHKSQKCYKYSYENEHCLILIVTQFDICRYFSLLPSYFFICYVQFLFQCVALNKMIDNTGWMSKRGFKKFYFLKGTVLYLRFQGSTKLRNWQFMLYLYALMHISSPRLPFPQ